LNAFNKKIFLLIYLLHLNFDIFAQIPIGIPTGTWRTHFDYTNIKFISFFNNKIYGSASKGFFYYDFEDNSLNKITNIDGLSSVGISALYSNSNNLFIGYEAGFLDIIYKSGEIKGINLFAGFKNSEIDKRVNNIFFHNNLIYVSTSLGVVVVDFSLFEIIETYTNIGKEGKSINSLETNIIGDSIFILSDNGLLKSLINDKVNLKDYNNWKLIELPNLSILGLNVLNNGLFIYDENKIFEYDGDGFNIFKSFSNDKIQNIKIQNNNLLITCYKSIFLLDVNKELQLKYITETVFFNDALMLNNNLWGATENGGIVNLELNNFLQPSSSLDEDVLKLFSKNTSVFGLKYLKDSDLSDDGAFSFFDGKIWTNDRLQSFKNLTSIAINKSDDIFFGSFGYGIYDLKNKQILNENSIGSTLQKVDNSTNSLFITDIMFDKNDNLYIANYGVESSLHFLDPEGIWHKFSFNNLKFHYPIGIIIGKDDIIWLRLDIKFGGGILLFNKKTNESIWLNKISNELPDNNISSIRIDKDDKVWIGTSRGIVLFNKSNIDDKNEKATILTIDGNKFLDNEKINSIAIDSGNRKWIASNNGAWLINSSNDSLLLNFNSKNSPIPSNKILDIAIDHGSGEVFFLSDKGLISYMSDAVTPKHDYSEIKIFPNPVSLKNHNVVSFYNLKDNSKIKIMTLSGDIINSFNSYGGGGSWNLLDLNRNIVSPGIYLILLSTVDKKDSFVQKILITN